MTEKGSKQRSAMASPVIQETRNTRLRARRKLLGLTQAYVTALLPDSSNSNRHLVGRIESGDVGMTDIRAVHLAQILRVPLAWLYGIEGWQDVPPDQDPYLNRETMYEQFLGTRQIERMTAGIDEGNQQARIEILNILVRNEIKKEGLEHGKSVQLRISQRNAKKTGQSI